ncbi:MAG: glycosyltransferase [Candidatus Pacebacteria bacterium]|nr:glycosyltransferase [Candidatus Paceibacterota bacterium]
MLSIIIPTKNEEKYLPMLLESIKRQTFRDYEIIVADNKSEDKTQEIARKYNCVIVQGGMPGPGRNAGARSAKGDVLLFLDSDTELENESFLELLVEEFNDRKLDAAVPMAYADGTSLDNLFYGFWNNLVKVFQRVSPFAGGWCIFATKNIHNKIKGFDERIVLGEDSDYAKRTAKIGKFRVLRGAKVKVSPRRFAEEGHLKIIIQSIWTGLHWAVKGRDKENKAGYKFNIYKDKK